MTAPPTYSYRTGFGYQLTSIAKRWREVVSAELEQHGLAPAVWRPLVHLASFGEVPRQRDLARSLQIGCPALVRLLDNLEAKGLVERIDVDDDRRAKQVMLTSEGRRIADLVHEVIADVERQLIEDLAPRELAAANHAFTAIEQRLGSFAPRRSAPSSPRIS